MYQRMQWVAAALIAICGCENSSPPVPVTPGTNAPAESPRASTLPDEQVMKLFGGESGWKPIVEPTRVEAYRVESSYADMAADGAPDGADPYHRLDEPGGPRHWCRY